MKSISILLLIISPILITSCASKEETSELPAANASPSPAVISQVVGQARIEPEGKISNLSSPVNGIVETVLKSENDAVKRGEVIVILEHEVEQARVAQSQSRLRIQASKIQSYESDVLESEARLANKQQEFRRLTALFEKGSETQQRIDDARTELSVLTATVQKAKANLETSKAELVEIEKAKDLAQAELNQRFIKAPGDGRLISMNAVPGASLNSQTSFAEFAPNGKLIARAEVDELFADKVRIGQPASIRLLGSEEPLTTGTVVYASFSLKRKSLFSEKAGDQEDRRVREVKIQIDDPKTLLINARVECVIKIGE